MFSTTIKILYLINFSINSSFNKCDKVDLFVIFLLIPDKYFHLQLIKLFLIL